tara:strand:+ start:651 stop:887 length:237 start_codon:yes stop_codon:yes gene_type:complete
MKIQDTYKDGQKYLSENGVTVVAVEYTRESTEAEQKLFGCSPIDITYGFFVVSKDGVTPDKRKKVAAPHESFLKYELK